MSKPLKATSIKFTPAQRRFLKLCAARQGHRQVSKVVKGLIDRASKEAT